MNFKVYVHRMRLNLRKNSRGSANWTPVLLLEQGRGILKTHVFSLRRYCFGAV